MSRYYYWGCSGLRRRLEKEKGRFGGGSGKRCRLRELTGTGHGGGYGVDRAHAAERGSFSFALIERFAEAVKDVRVGGFR